MHDQTVGPTSGFKGLSHLLTLLLFVLLSLSVSSQNIERELEMGKEAKQQLEQQIGFYEHPANEYLDGIGQRLVSNLDDRLFDYEFGILDMKEPNALALPGGYVYFSRGILIMANSKDELGGVMGHEIIHVYKHHSRKANNKSIFTGILKVPGAIVGVFSPVAGGILMAPFSLMDASYSRKHEKQADELGAALASASGYDPEGLVIILDKIAQDAELETGMEEQRSFFSTHPYTPKRIENLNKTVEKINHPETTDDASSRKDFLEKLSGMVIGDNPANGVFLDSLFLHPEMHFTFAYPKGWEGVNLPQVVGLISPDLKAQLAFSLADTLKTPSQIADDFERDYYRYYRRQPDRTDSLDISGLPAHIISYQGYVEEELVVLSLLWIKHEKQMYRLAMFSTDQYRDVITEVANSLHTISQAERKLIKQTLLQVVEAKDGESLEELTARTGNSLDLDYTALINNMEEDTKLSEGQLIKIGKVSPY